MSDANVVSLVDDPVERYLLLDVDKATGQQKALSLIAYAADPDDAGHTLIFGTPSPHAYTAMRIKFPFQLFHVTMQMSSHLSIVNITKEHIELDPQSSLGRVASDFKARIAEAVHTQGGITFH